jgi:hypothetical protein
MNSSTPSKQIDHAERARVDHARVAERRELARRVVQRHAARAERLRERDRKSRAPRATH